MTSPAPQTPSDPERVDIAPGAQTPPANPAPSASTDADLIAALRAENASLQTSLDLTVEALESATAALQKAERRLARAKDKLAERDDELQDVQEQLAIGTEVKSDAEESEVGRLRVALEVERDRRMRAEAAAERLRPGSI
ncbi:hypothetical protein JCM10207_003351 [Rhodosporidiobolus poonsookiae]